MTQISGALLSRLSSVVDPFASPLRTSHYLELLNPLWGTHRRRARVVSVWDETPTARTLTLRPGRGWRRHRAGQHVRVGVPIGGMHHVRTYSISSPPEHDDGCFTITVNAAAGGRVSSHLVRSVRPGDHLAVGLPQGDFVLPDAAPVRPLFITAGSGITPVMSMLRGYAARGELPSIVHLHYAPQPQDVIFAKELAMLREVHGRYRLRLAFTRDGEGRSTDRHFGATELEDACPDWRERDVWVCGPQGLIAAVEDHWRAAGLARNVHVERFHAAWAPFAQDVAGGRVRFARSGIEVTSDGRLNLLRLAEDAGLNPPHGCRMGICHSCDVRLVSGCVRDLRSGAVANEAEGTVQLCVSTAAGDVELEV